MHVAFETMKVEQPTGMADSGSNGAGHAIREDHRGPLSYVRVGESIMAQKRKELNNPGFEDKSKSWTLPSTYFVFGSRCFVFDIWPRTFWTGSTEIWEEAPSDGRMAVELAPDLELIF